MFTKIDTTAWKVWKYGVFLVRIFSPNTGKYGTEKTPYFSHFSRGENPPEKSFFGTAIYKTLSIAIHWPKKYVRVKNRFIDSRVVICDLPLALKNMSNLIG